MPARLTLLPTLLLLTLLLLAPVRAADPPPPPATAKADLDPASPKGALKAFYEAMEASDAAAVRACFHTSTDDERQLADAYANLLLAARSFGEAAKAKFGATGDALSKGMPVKDELARLPAAEVTQTADAATVRLNPKGKPIRLVKGDGNRWRINVADYAGATPESIADHIKTLREFTTVFTSVTADITSDKIQTAPDAQRALQQKLQATLFTTLQKNPPTTAPSPPTAPK